MDDLSDCGAVIEAALDVRRCGFDDLVRHGITECVPEAFRGSPNRAWTELALTFAVALTLLPPSIGSSLAQSNHSEELNMEAVTTIGLDIAKSVF
jgi:hypothetical protein